MNFDFNELNNLRIHELRDLARKVGVKSPTSLKKEIIIKNILLILSGEIKPYVNKTKQGRPSKSMNKFNNLVNLSTLGESENKENEPEPFNLNKNGSFDSVLNSNPASYNSNHIEKAKGYLFINKNGYGVIRLNGFFPSDEDIFVHPYLIKNFNLQTGDYIEGNIELIEEDNSKIMVSLVSVNNNLATEKQNGLIRFNNLPYNSLNLNLIYSNNINTDISNKLKQLNILEGSRVLFLNKSYYKFSSIKQICKTLNESYKIYIINLDSRPEEKCCDDNKNIVLQNINFNELDLVKVEVATLMLEVAKKEVEHGKKVVVIVNRISSLIKALNNLEDKTVSEYLKVETIHKIKNFLMCAKNVNENTNLTLLVFDTLNINRNIKDFVEFDISLIFNNLIYFSANENDVIDFK